MLPIQLQRINPNSFEHKGNVGKKSTAKKRGNLLEQSTPSQTAHREYTRFPFEQPEAWVHVIIFF